MPSWNRVSISCNIDVYTVLKIALNYPFQRIFLGQFACFNLTSHWITACPCILRKNMDTFAIWSFFICVTVQKIAAIVSLWSSKIRQNRTEIPHQIVLRRCVRKLRLVDDWISWYETGTKFHLSLETVEEIKEAMVTYHLRHRSIPSNILKIPV